jgi:hypothetical protein
MPHLVLSFDNAINYKIIPRRNKMNHLVILSLVRVTNANTVSENDKSIYSRNQTTLFLFDYMVTNNKNSHDIVSFVGTVIYQ